jgi:hypothetical protein
MSARRAAQYATRWLLNGALFAAAAPAASTALHARMAWRTQLQLPCGARGGARAPPPPLPPPPLPPGTPPPSLARHGAAAAALGRAPALLAAPRGALLRTATSRASAPASAASLAEAPAAQPATQAADDAYAWDAVPGAAWESVQRWVVFSDLHVSVRSEAVCLEVLREARARSAPTHTRAGACTRQRTC